MIKAIIFDADGTLLDSMHIWEELGERYLKAKGICAERNLGSILYPMTLEESSNYLKNRYDIKDKADIIQKDILRLLENFYQKEVLFKKGVLPFLEQMKEKGTKMGIATSGDKTLLISALKRLCAYRYFSAVTTCSELGTSKRESLIYLETAKLLGAEPKETAVFEDVLYGILAAKNAGFLAVAVEDASNLSAQKQLKENADFYIKDFNDTVLEQL